MVDGLPVTRRSDGGHGDRCDEGGNPPSPVRPGAARSCACPDGARITHQAGAEIRRCQFVVTGRQVGQEISLLNGLRHAVCGAPKRVATTPLSRDGCVAGVPMRYTIEGAVNFHGEDFCGSSPQAISGSCDMTAVRLGVRSRHGLPGKPGLRGKRVRGKTPRLSRCPRNCDRGVCAPFCHWIPFADAGKAGRTR